MVNAYDTLSDGQSWTHTIQNEVGTALGAIDSVGFRPHKPATFVIFVEDSTYYRVDGANGEVDASSSDAYTLIQNAINALGTDGGRIFIKKGDYTLNTGLAVADYSVTIDGEGKGVKSLGGVSTSGTRLICDGATYGIDYDATRHCRLANLTLDFSSNGNANVDGVVFNARESTIENVHILNPIRYGISVDGGDIGGFYNLFRNIKIRSNAANCTADFYFHTTGAFNPNANLLLNCTLSGTASYKPATGVDVDAGSSIILISVGIENVSSEFVETSKSETQLYSCYLENSDSNGLNIEAGATNFLMVGGRISTVTGSKVVDNGTNSKFRDVLYYKTDNSGTSTGTGATQNIAHGCSVTPNRIGFGQTSVGTGYPVQTSGANSTYIFVSAGSAVTYDWHAWKA